MHQAQFWESLENQKVHCHLCRFHCVIAEGRRGRCGVRENQSGTLYSLVYGRSISEQVDPIEKKPLFHFYPGSRSLSIATVGCNFRCLHCQNADISQWPHERGNIPGSPLEPVQIVKDAAERNCVSIAYTYTEPTIYFEYAYDTAVLAREAGVRNVFVTNGYTTPEPLAKIAPYLDGANVDLKGFSDSFYREVTGASLDGVLECLRDYRRLGIWIEVTTLVIPGLNDSDADLNGIAEFIAGELGVHVPWHVSAFYPTYKMLDRPPTRVENLLKARAAGRRAGLQYIYLGNVPGTDGEDTLCPGCGAVVIHRRGFRLQALNVQGGQCAECGHEVAGVGLG
ncbi:MAG TPA: AmmeMemoRadiSam system radical SAM enzyme [Desulfuromonadales bacterium]|nr:AmmeMemoRadiSam system radical SAM enzyme [Desulfuromonadales bacterium]